MSTRGRRQQLSAFIQQKRRTDDRGARRRTSSTLGTSGPHALPFTPARHHLTWPQCQVAAQLLARAEARRPFTGTPEQIRFRRALRIAGILSAVKRGVVGKSRFGRSLQGHHGGNVMRDHGLHILRANAPKGVEASRLARDRRRAAAHWEATGEVLPLEVTPPRDPQVQHIQDLIDAWEGQQWQTQRDFLSW